MIRRSVVGYTLLDQMHGYCAIVHNLAGFMCFFIVKGNPRDRWSGTKVHHSGAEMKQPQQIDSWFAGHLLGWIVEGAKKQEGMSDREQQKVREAMRKNPTASAFRFREFDQQVQVVE
jgi:hypothetical protein